MAGGLTIPGKLNIGSATSPKDFDAWLTASIEEPNGGDTHLRLKTKGDTNKNLYLINRDGHFRLNTHGVADVFGVNRDGHHYVRHTGDHVMHVEGDGDNPYISLGKTGTWANKKIYMQNVAAQSDAPTFRIGVHGKRQLLDISESQGLRLPRRDGRTTHFDWEDNKNYIRGDTIIDGNVTVNGTVTINGSLNATGGITAGDKSGNVLRYDDPMAFNMPHASNDWWLSEHNGGVRAREHRGGFSVWAPRKA